MDDKKFNLLNRICAAAAFVVSALTYLFTIEPTASFWDCGEFIASSYKLEVGHPPGNPMFQLIARFFTIFGDNMHAAMLVNAMSAICSALTIFLLYLTIVFFVKRVTKNPVAICGSALVGALAYCFSDTFWFSAVEGEVYAMSSLFTALVFWAMTKWYEQADSPGSNRWIVLIAFLMGLSIGVHLLNLLAIPAIVFMYYYRSNEDKKFTFKELIKIFLVGVAILAIILFIIVPFTPKLAAYVDLFFVNVLGLPYNVGAAFFVLALIGGCFYLANLTYKKGKVFWNTAILSLAMILIGFSVFSVCVIRSCAKTPTNEYQPDNAFTLVRYLNREQYGSQPLVYGQYYGAPYDLKTNKYWAPVGGKYRKVDAPIEAEYSPEGKMLFPRMWNPGDSNTIEFYKRYTNGKGKRVAGAEYPKPTMGANLAYFFDYQLNWMYWRYFMWNFVGRQNDIHSTNPGDVVAGNWESGIGFLDEIRLGDQSEGPDMLTHNKGKNHYFFLPLLLGLLGLFFQFDKDKRGCWLIFLMFFMTGIAIVMYLNQPPFQVRERDYAYAGSFYFFCVWIGFAVAAISEWIDEVSGQKKSMLAATAVSVACLLVPGLMAAQNWDDHDRSNRATAPELAANYLNTVPQNGILITHGDNDTFPLWYAQEVENVRPDVRIVNTSLLGTDWHIDQMKYAVNESAPLPLTVPLEQYLYGTNDFVPIVDKKNTSMLISDVMAIFKHPQIKYAWGSKKVDYIPSRHIILPVNKENVIKYGILSEKYADQIPDSIELVIPEAKTMLSKGELFLLDLLSNYNWDRPLCMLNMGGDLNVGQKDYLEYRGLSYMFVPIKSRTASLKPGFADPDELYAIMKGKLRFDALGRDDYYVDYQNIYTFAGVQNIRNMSLSLSDIFRAAGHDEWAVEALDMGRKAMKNFPLVTSPIGLQANDYALVSIINSYFELGRKETALEMVKDTREELLKGLKFYLSPGTYSQDGCELLSSMYYLLTDMLKEAGEPELRDEMLEDLKDLLS